MVLIFLETLRTLYRRLKASHDAHSNGSAQLQGNSDPQNERTLPSIKCVSQDCRETFLI